MDDRLLLLGQFAHIVGVAVAPLLQPVIVGGRGEVGHPAFALLVEPDGLPTLRVEQVGIGRWGVIVRGLVVVPVAFAISVPFPVVILVIVVIVSIAVSTDVYDRFLDFGDVGGIIGMNN